MTTNPITWIGDRPEQGYACIPNELARDGKLSSVARSVALYLWSHDNGWKSSQAAIAKALGIGNRDTVKAALDELSECRWLAIRKVGRTAHSYYAHPARKLTEAEHSELSQLAQKSGMGLPENQACNLPKNRATKKTNKKTNEEHGSYVSNAGASAQNSPSAADEKELIDCTDLLNECAAMFRTPLQSGLGVGECSGSDGDDQFVYEQDIYNDDQDDWSEYADQD